MNDGVSIMFITNKVYEAIVNNVPDVFLESGGIIGGYHNIIYFVEFDNGIHNRSVFKCHYTPDVKYLNRCIKAWRKRRIDFYGIFHTHFYGVSTLSEGDKQYIKRIMQSMPDSKTVLYFPIVVLPEREIVSYICVRNNGKITITEDSIIIVQEI